MNAGTLYVVATPIGNLGDMTPRAVEVLQRVARIAAEDTRHSAGLLRHFGIHTPLFALHEHNEREASAEVVRRLLAGEDIALISDAGTPLISDPGFPLTRLAHEAGIRVVPVPGASALIAALSAAGLPTDRFAFEGFLPARSVARRQVLAGLAGERRTLAFYEAPHRLLETLEDMTTVFGSERLAVLARELTKTFETLRRAPLGELVAFVRSDSDQQRGEAVLLVQGAPPPAADALEDEPRRIAELLVAELPVKQAAALAAKITGAKKNLIYDYLIKRQQ
ncbi:MAG: 16S rRNA (cytidine(1402)-2'-O)-methyltransferase [Thiohalomonadaceae bacterium]